MTATETPEQEPAIPSGAATIRPVQPDEWPAVCSVLDEAAGWLRARGDVMWEIGELAPESVRDQVEAGLFYFAEVNGEIAGVFRFQLEDPEFWPDLADPALSAFVHRLAVRRRFAGLGVSAAILEWAADRTCSLGRSWLRLDCDADRERLRAVYERAGFIYHSDRQVGPYLVARYEMAVFRRDRDREPE